MYQQEAKEEVGERERNEASHHQGALSPTLQQPQGQRLGTGAPSESDPYPAAPPASQHHHHLFATSSSNENPPPAVAHSSNGGAGGGDDTLLVRIVAPEFCGSDVQVGPTDDMYRNGTSSAATLGPAAPMRFGTAGDVSLTLGLRHVGGNASEKDRFSAKDFGGC